MAAREAQESHPLLRPEQTKLARDSRHSVFSIEVNLYHLLPGGEDNADSKRAYYLRTHKVDPELPKTPEEEEEAKRKAAAAKNKEEEPGRKKRTRGASKETAALAKNKEEEPGMRKRTRGASKEAAAPAMNKEEEPGMKGRTRGASKEAAAPAKKEEEESGMKRRTRGASKEAAAKKEEEAKKKEEEAKKKKEEAAAQKKVQRKRATASNAQETFDDEASEPPVRKGPKTSHRNDGQRTSTGFAIAQDPDGTTLRILTCAHTIDEVYGPGVHDITVKEVNRFFSFDVHCSHQEMRILNKLNGNRIEEQDRVTTQASVVAIDTEKDLMVLEIDTRDIHYEGGGIMCKDRHPPITMVGSDSDLSELEVFILQGWPPQQLGSLSVGQLSFESRTYDAIEGENEKGYSMLVSEFASLVGDEGSSGAPVINGTGKCAGVYHGVIGSKGYAVSAREVIQFLNEFGMLSDWPSDDEDQ